MDYYNVHLRKTSDPKIVTFNKLERGMVVKIRYKKASGTNEYILLVLQPFWEGKLHALSLNNIKPQKVLEIAKNYKEILAESTRVRKLDLAKVNVTNTTSKVFYTSEIKNDKNLKVGYRIFDVKKIQSIRVVNYDWGKYDRIKPEAERNKDK